MTWSVADLGAEFRSSEPLQSVFFQCNSFEPKGNQKGCYHFENLSEALDLPFALPTG